jgi:hypothetical protein
MGMQDYRWDSEDEVRAMESLTKVGFEDSKPKMRKKLVCLEAAENK